MNIINKSWSQGRIPGSWRNAVIVPLLKNGKPASQINSYRPVSLLACVSKVIESMVTRRLKKWAADMGAIPPQQSGFQKGRMTLDVIANITQKAFDSLQSRERTVVVAFDRVWKFGLFRDLARRKLHPVALRWLKAYLLPLPPCFSAWRQRPCRPVCSAAPGVFADQYADDFTMSASARTVPEAADLIRPALQEVESWASDYEVLLSTEKTSALVVSLDPRETAGEAYPALYLLGDRVGTTKGVKILGVTLDSQLSSTPSTSGDRSWLNPTSNPSM